MQATNVNQFLDDPLFGCSDTVQQVISIQVLVEKLLSFLQLMRTTPKGDKIFEMIEKEKKRIGINHREYVINEMLYEVRLGTLGDNRITSEAFENVLINRWFKIVYKRDGEDKALNFVVQLKKNRANRKRIW